MMCWPQIDWWGSGVKSCGCHEMLKVVSLTAAAYCSWFMVACLPSVHPSICVQAPEMGFHTTHGMRFRQVPLLHNFLLAKVTRHIKYDRWKILKRDLCKVLGWEVFGHHAWMAYHCCLFYEAEFSVMNANLTRRWVGVLRMASIPNTGCVPFQHDSDTSSK